MSDYWNSTATYDKLEGDIIRPTQEEFDVKFDNYKPQKKVRGLASLLTALFIASIPVFSTPSPGHITKDSLNTPQKEILYKESTINANTHTISLDPTPLAPADNPLDNIFVDGYVTGKPDQTSPPHPPVWVVAYNVPPGAPLDSVLTDSDGYYKFASLPVGTHNHDKTTLESKLFPNPFKDNTNIEVYINKSDSYQLLVVGADGKILINTDVKLQEGVNKIPLFGGKDGLYGIRLTNGKENFEFKGINNGGDGNPLQVGTPQIADQSVLKSTSTGGDSVMFVYKSPGYVTTDTTVATQPILNIDKDIWLTHHVVDFTVAAMYHADTVRQNGAVKLQLSNGVNQTFNVQNGFIHVHMETYDPISDTAYLSNADTTLFSPWLWGRLQDQPLDQDILFQSAKEQSTGTYIPPGPAPLNLTMLPDTFNLFFQVKEVDDPVHPGQKIRTYDNIDFRTLAWGSSPGVSIKYVFVPQSVDSIDNFRIRKDENTGQLVSQQLYDEMIQLNETALSLTKLPYNNINYMSPLKNVNADDLTDPRVVAALQRTPSMDQSILTQYRDGTNAGCHSYPTTVNGINGQPRIYYSYSKYKQSSPKAVKLTEMICQLINADDASTSGATDFLSTTTGDPTEFAKVLVYTIMNDRGGTPD